MANSEALSAMTKTGSGPEAESDAQALASPAANRRRMWMALAVLAALGVLAWFTLDGTATLPVKGYSFGGFGFSGFALKVRWIPELILGLFAFRVITANMRARLEDKNQESGDRSQ
jgi:4-hydroxybenzoate polyprenyltransferase